MPGLKPQLLSQSLNSSKTEKSEKKQWHWPRWLSRKRKVTSSTSQLMNIPTGVVLNNDDMPSHSQADGNSNRGSPEVVQHMEDIVKDTMVCLLCLQIPNKWFTIESCGCQFCLQCMEMYAHCSVRSGEVPITCPDGHCPLSQNGSAGQLSRNEVRQLVPNDVFPLYLRLQLNSEVAVNPRLVWCPRPGCETVCKLKETPHHARKSKSKLFGLFRTPMNQQRNYSVVCTSCQFDFCSACRTPWHKDSPCPSLSQLLSSDPTKKQGHESDDPIALLERDGRIKRCPFCQVPIERDDGCAQMMCKNCRHVFCWFCLTSLDDDFMLRHYDTGPCRSRLGHSRVSVVWHRTQVVSAFLGLGVLFLVTSPLLLLASPCFLCWRHSQNKSSSRSPVEGTTLHSTSGQESM